MEFIAETPKYAEPYLIADRYRNERTFWFCPIRFHTDYSLTEFYYSFLCFFFLCPFLGSL